METLRRLKEYAARPEVKARTRERTRAKRATTKEQARIKRNRVTYKKSPAGIEAAKRYRKGERGRVANVLKSHRRKQRIRCTVNDLTSDQWRDILAAYDHTCIYCGGRGADDDPIQLEHVRAIDIGGQNTAANVVPACGPCNQRKGNLTLLAALTKLRIKPLDYLFRRAMGQLKLRAAA